jgi:hypothetical protein
MASSSELLDTGKLIKTYICSSYFHGGQIRNYSAKGKAK